MIRLSSRQYTAMQTLYGSVSLPLDTAKKIFQGTLGSLVQRGYLKYNSGQIHLSQTGKEALNAMTSENIFRKSAEKWGNRVILILPKSLR